MAVSVRYYMAPIIGDGTSGNPYRLKVADATIKGHASLIPDGAQWGLAIVAAENHGPVSSGSGVVELPDLSPDDALTTLPGPARAGIQNALNARGVPFTLSGEGKKQRDLIRAIGRHLQPDFNEDNLRVSAG